MNDVVDMVELRCVTSPMIVRCYWHGRYDIIAADLLWLRYKTRTTYLRTHPVGFCRYFEEKPSWATEVEYGALDGEGIQRPPILGES